MRATARPTGARRPARPGRSAQPLIVNSLVVNDALDRSTAMLLMNEALARARMHEVAHPAPRVSRGARRPALEVAAAAAQMRDRL